jgi:hypothetical protein
MKLRGQRANGTVVRTGREVVRSRGQGAQWSRSAAGRVAFMRWLGAEHDVGLFATGPAQALYISETLHWHG